MIEQAQEDKPIAFSVERLGVVMAPRPDDPHENCGVLNPAGATGLDGDYYLFPRLVGSGNYSRIGLARVHRDAHGRPRGVERLGIALAPEARYEIVRPGRGGCEDPRVTYLDSIGLYVMVYTALGPRGPRVAIATSPDLRRWTRRGLVDFAVECNVEFNACINKDGILFPETVQDPHGEPAIALMHRPIFGQQHVFDRVPHVKAGTRGIVDDDRPSIWLSFCPQSSFRGWMNGTCSASFAQHHLLAAPREEWEAYRIGGGTVPVRTADGWLSFYHGVERLPDGERCYRAGALVLDYQDPRRVLARTLTPIFGPESVEERVGTVNNVVFPTAVDEFRDGFDLYYGMADSYIGAAHLTVGEFDAAMVA